MIERMRLHEFHEQLFEKSATDVQRRLYTTENACGFLSTGTDDEVLATTLLALVRARTKVLFIVPEFRRKRITKQIEKSTRRILGVLDGSCPKTRWELKFRVTRNLLLGSRVQFEREPDSWVACGFSSAEAVALPGWFRQRLV